MIRAGSRLSRAGAGALLALALAAGGCSLADEEPEPSETPVAEAPAPRGTTVERTRVEVVEEGSRGGGLDAAALYRRLSPGVVTILSLFGTGANPDSGGQGSGFVLDGDGHVVTNAHVVTEGGRVGDRADEVYVAFSNGDRVPARILGTDPNADIAVLKIDPSGLSLTPIELGSSQRLKVGEPVAAIGSPFGEEQSLSLGVVSAVDRDITSLNGAFGIGNAIQTDAAINRGNSGGPLLNSRGQVVGVIAQIKTESDVGGGVGFAIPMQVASRSIEDLRTTGEVRYGYLGVQSTDLYPRLADHLKVDADSGAIVSQVEDGSPADEAGLDAGDDRTDFQGGDDIPRNGDVVLAVDGRAITRRDNLADLIVTKRPGDEVTLEVLRAGKRREVTVELGARPRLDPRN